MPREENLEASAQFHRLPTALNMLDPINILGANSPLLKKLTPFDLWRIPKDSRNQLLQNPTQEKSRISTPMKPRFHLQLRK